MGSAPNRPHVKGKQDYNIPHLVCDYCFLGDKDDGETLIVQVTRDITSKCLFAHAVPRKGVSHIFGAEQVCKDIESLGYKDVVIKTDNEPAMLTLQEEIKSRRVDKTILENSPVGESQSNGIAESRPSNC